MTERLKKTLIYASVIIGIIGIDLVTKWLAVKFLSPIDTCPLIEDVLHLTYVENRGAAFGMLADQRWIFIAVSSVTIVALGIYLFLGKAQNALYEIGFLFVIGGGIGNMIDRLALGYVIDFIDFRLINFAVFNGADSFVCVGAGFLVLALVLDIIKEIKANKKKN